MPGKSGSWSGSIVTGDDLQFVVFEIGGVGVERIEGVDRRLRDVLKPGAVGFSVTPPPRIFEAIRRAAFTRRSPWAT